jgi:hypothetical protein
MYSLGYLLFEILSLNSKSITILPNSPTATSAHISHREDDPLDDDDAMNSLDSESLL